MDAIYLFEIINFIFLVVIVILGAAITLKFKQKDTELLKARMFLGKTIENMWIYSTIAGAAFIVHQLLWALEQFFNVKTGKMIKISWTLFIISFTYLTFAWFKLIDKSIKR